MSFKSSSMVTMLGAIALLAAAPSWASLIADGVTYTLLESTLSPTEDEFTLEITGINAPSDSEGGRYGVNSLAFTEPNPPGSVVSGSLSHFTFMTGGLNAMGCDGTGNFYCFKATTAPAAPALPANSALTFTFDLTVAQAGELVNYDPSFKIQWLGSKSGKYDLVSQTLTPIAVPLPAALPMLLSALAGLGFLGRSGSAGPVSARSAPGVCAARAAAC
jgi:hypothetical protein